MTFQLGDVVPLSVTVKDADGNPADAGSVTLTVTPPDGVPVTVGPISPTTTGVYDHNYPTAQAGVHQVRWVATGANASAFDDVFSVEAPAGGTFISLAEIKRHLKKDLAKTDDDAELLEFIDSACQMIEDRIGPVAPVTVTQMKWCKPLQVIILDQHPVISVTSVTIDGNALPEADPAGGVSGWTLEGDAGLLGHSRRWPWGRIEVTYRAGRTPLPGNIRLAALELAGHLWRSTKLNASGGRPPVSGSDELALRNVGFALPYRVRELLGLGKLPTNDVQVG